MNELCALSVRLRGNGTGPVEVLILNRGDETLLKVGEFAYEEVAVKFANNLRIQLAAAGLKVGAGVYWEDWCKSQTAALAVAEQTIAGRIEPLLDR